MDFSFFNTAKQAEHSDIHERIHCVFLSVCGFLVQSRAREAPSRQSAPIIVPQVNRERHHHGKALIPNLGVGVAFLLTVLYHIVLRIIL